MIRLLFILLTSVVLFFSVKPVFAQEAEKKQGSAEQDTLAKVSTLTFKPKFTPFLAPSFAPETEAMLIIGGLVSFKFEPDNSLLNASSIPFAVGYSTNKSLMVNFRPYLYFAGDKYRLYGNIWVKNMPDNYFGVGFEKNSTLSRGQETTQYKRSWWQFDIRFLREVRKYLYAGLLFDFNKTNAKELNPLMATDPNITEDGTFIHNRGIGLNLEYDSRDVPINAFSGVFINLSSTFYGDYLGSDFNYTVLGFDYRQYKTIQREGRTLAWQIRNRTGIGSLPWPEMAQPGTPFDLRGYRWGQYRDMQMTFAIMEYRHTFMRKNPDKNGRLISKHGLAGWLAAGTIYSNPDEINSWLPNAGLGYRFEVQPRMNARVDFGIGRKTSGFYISLNEAF